MKIIFTLGGTSFFSLPASNTVAFCPCQLFYSLFLMNLGKKLSYKQSSHTHADEEGRNAPREGALQRSNPY